MSPCPSCFVPLPSAQAAWMCASGDCAPPPGAPGGDSGPVSVRDRPVGPAAAGPTLCDVCHGVTVEVCPAPTCHFVLPHAWRDTAVTTVVLAGARATGKSMYIAVLIQQLREFGDDNRIGVSLATRQSTRTYETVYEQPLMRQRALDPTPPVQSEDAYQREPLIVELAPANRPRHYLVLRDLSGEDLQEEVLDAENIRFVSHADALLFLYDPLVIPDLRALLAGLVPSAGKVAGNSRLVLDNLLRLIEGRRPRLALVLSKFDTLHAARRLRGGDHLSRIMQNTGAAFSRDPGWNGPYLEEDGRLLHEEIRSLLRWLGAGWLTTAMDRLATQQNVDQRFFAVSALGDAPDGQYLHDRGIAPFRCLDPIRWILTGRVL